MKLTNKRYKFIQNLVYNYKTKHEHGFIWSEQQEILKQFPGINMDKYFEVQKGITCQMSTDGIIIYHCDVLQSLVCGLENRNLYAHEWD